MVDFGHLVVNVNRAFQFKLLEKMFPIYHAVNEYLQKQNFPPCIAVSQHMRLHLPRESFGPSLLSIASRHELYNQRRFPSEYQWRPIRERQRLRNPGETMAVGFLLYDVCELHVLVQLLHDTLMELLHRSDVECFIVALQKPEPSPQSMLNNLYDEYIAKGRWIQTTYKNCQQHVQNLRLDLLVDCVAEAHGYLPFKDRPRPGLDAFVNAHYLNTASILSGGHSWDFAIFDKFMKSTVPVSVAAPPEGPVPPQREGVLVVSHWQPAIARDLLDGLQAVLPARRRAAETEAFNILCPASFDRIALEQLELLFKLALEIPSSILYVGCHPTNCVEEVERRAGEQRGGPGKGSKAGRAGEGEAGREKVRRAGGGSDAGRAGPGGMRAMRGAGG